MRYRLLNMILFVLIALSIQSQSYGKKDFKVYRTKDGLSNNDIWAITQDDHGYLWIGTKKGLNRFDGNTFQKFYSDSSSKSLPSDWAHNLRWINKDELGVLTLSGLQIINFKTLKRRNILIPVDSSKLSSTPNQSNDVIGDQNGNLFILTEAGFYHMLKDHLVFRYDHRNKQNRMFGLRLNWVDQKTVLLTTSEGLYIYNIEKKDIHDVGKNDDPFFRNATVAKNRDNFVHSDGNSFSIIDPEKKEITFFDLIAKTIQTIHIPGKIFQNIDHTSIIFQLSDTLMAITGARHGFYWVRPQINSWVVDPIPNFEGDFCSALFLDKNERLWVGTVDGLYQQNTPGGRIEKTQLPPLGLSHEKVITALTVAGNKVFVSTALAGLYVFDRDSLLFLQHLMTREKDFSYINQIVKLNEDSLLIARNGAVVKVENLQYKKIDFEKNVPLSKVMKMTFKNSENILYVTKNRSDSVFFKKPGDTRFSSFRVPEMQKVKTPEVIAEDHRGNLWFGGSGLIRLNRQTNKVDLFVDSFPIVRRLSKRISSNIVFDKNDIAYFGVSENGLIIYNVRENKFAHITRDHGLPDNLVKYVHLHNRTLWIATDNGLASYDLDDKRVVGYGSADGMPIDPNGCDVLYYDSLHKHLYVTFTNTIVRFDPDKLKKNQNPPTLFIESIDITGKEPLYNPGENVTVAYKYNSLTVNMSSINYEDASQQLFAYRLVKNGSESWQEIGTQRRIFLNNLPVGKHKLQLKVYIRNQSWADQVKEIILTVKPPFWKTIWFYLVIGLLIATLLFYLHRLKIRQLTQKANIDRQLAQTEMKALHAQMNPHFIFNCLNSIREMILHNENQQASHYLSKFAQLIRNTLNQSSKTFVTLENTVDYLQRYAEMEKIRNNKFSYTIEVDEQLPKDEIMIPPMLIQPFLENAIWHGAIPGKELQINIRFKKEDNRLVCFVEDNGLGIETSINNKKEMQADHNSIGIANVKERIQVLNEKYKLNSELSIEDRSKNGIETGTLVKLYFPLHSMAS